MSEHKVNIKFTAEGAKSLNEELKKIQKKFEKFGTKWKGLEKSGTTIVKAFRKRTIGSSAGGGRSAKIARKILDKFAKRKRESSAPGFKDNRHLRAEMEKKFVRNKLKELENISKQIQEIRIKAQENGALKTLQDAENLDLEVFTRQFDIAASAQGKLDAAFRENIPSLDEDLRQLFDDGAGGFGFPIEQMAEPLKKLKEQAGPVEAQFDNLSSSYREQTMQVKSLVPAMKQAGAGLKGMEGMLTSFASKSGPALENFLGGLMRGKGGLTESLLAA
jgi:hypothetical protein